MVTQISLSKCTRKGNISKLSEDILDQVVAELKARPYFTLQSPKTTDVMSSEEMLAYTYFVRSESMKIKFLFSDSLTTTECGEVVFKTVQNFITKWLQ
jgi:hypothetical protein